MTHAVLLGERGVKWGGWVSSRGATVTKYHSLGGVNSRNLLSSRRMVSPEASVHAYRRPLSPRVLA